MGMIAAHVYIGIRACLCCDTNDELRAKMCAVRRSCDLPQQIRQQEGRHDEQFEPYCTSTVGTEQLPCAAFNASSKLQHSRGGCYVVLGTINAPAAPPAASPRLEVTEPDVQPDDETTRNDADGDEGSATNPRQQPAMSNAARTRSFIVRELCDA